VVILISWPGSRVWYVNPDCHQYFFNISLYQFCFSIFSFNIEFIKDEASLYFYVLLSMMITQYHDPCHGFSMLIWIDSRLLHHFIYISNLVLILLIFFAFDPFFLISSFNIGLLRIELHIVFQCDDPSLMTRVTYMKY
jgi:hypothetical protein